jgi:hypothetical protein
MAKTQFHKNQHVYVKSVSTWTLIERAVPYWIRDIDEPIRIHDGIGLGREFAAEELLNDKAPGTYPVAVTEELAHRAPHLLSDVKRTS